MDSSNGYLTTHVLDTANGIPAAGVSIELCRIDGAARQHLVTARTNADGRTDAPLLPRGQMIAGEYELVFGIGDYFAARGNAGARDFIDTVPIRFRLNDSGAHYHVPLLASPYCYSTYRGS